MRINRENAVALVIDFQEKLIPAIGDANGIIRNSVMLIKALKILHVPILVTQQNTKGLGSTVPGISEAIDDFRWFEKMTFSCLREPEFKKALEQTEKHHIIILGLEAHICVLQSALDLFYNNYSPMIVEDCIGSSNVNDKRVALWRMRDVGALVTTSESILFELCREAGTDEFKEILKLIKERNNA
jgi:nicotinamidase-related amidase